MNFKLLILFLLVFSLVSCLNGKIVTINGEGIDSDYFNDVYDSAREKARKDIESKTGKKVITGKNAKRLNLLNKHSPQKHLALQRLL